MKQRVSYLLGLALSIGIVPEGLSAPWYTGPIIAPAGRTIPKGHTNLEIYSFNTFIEGVYDAEGHISKDRDHRSYSILPVLTQGLTDKIDIQGVTSYNFSENNGQHSDELGDTTIALGYQALVEKEGCWRPNLRLSLSEILPTGPFEYLNPIKNGTDASGLGSYQTAFGLNLQKLTHFKGVHYLRTRVILNYVIASQVHVHGFSTYGGHSDTNGFVNPGNSKVGDISFEYSLTQRWVAVMEANASRRDTQNFSGVHGTVHSTADDINDMDTIGSGVGKQVSLAPAIEYNFSDKVGIIAGAWFPVYGRSTAKFVSAVVAVNAYW